MASEGREPNETNHGDRQMTATEISYTEYMAKVNASEINSHSLEVANGKWTVLGFDGDDKQWVAETPFTGSSSEAKQQLRDEVGLDDEISGPYPG